MYRSRQSIVSEQRLLDVLYFNDGSVASSGDYQRYYTVEGKAVPSGTSLTLKLLCRQGKYYRALTVMTEDSGVADFMSTTLFLLPYTEGKSLVDNLDRVETYG